MRGGWQTASPIFCRDRPLGRPHNRAETQVLYVKAKLFWTDFYRFDNHPI